MAPEIIREQAHDERVDIWCIGVLLFELTTGTLPFQGETIEALKNNILNLKISWPKDINLDAKNLIIKILKIEPEQRISLTDMIQHDFFTKHLKDPLQFLIKPEENLDCPFLALVKISSNNSLFLFSLITEFLTTKTKELHILIIFV